MVTEPLLRLCNISKRFESSIGVMGRLARFMGAGDDSKVVHALDCVSLSVRKGEVIGLVGESGCGKSTLGRIAAGVLPASEGKIQFRGKELSELTSGERKRRALEIQMIFQDPFSSMNPRMRIRDIVGEAPLVHGLVKRAEIESFLDDLLTRVGLDPDYKQRYPHQFSGGQRQRICIARALAVQPQLIICDEAVAALDVSIQAQVLNLFMQLRRDLNLTYLFISHDLGVVEHLSDRVVIMYLGRIVEAASTDELFTNPKHPYTRALLADMPRLDRRNRDYHLIKGEIPSPINPPQGCHFHPRCPHAMERCRIEVPELKVFAGGHKAACHLYEQKMEP